MAALGGALTLALLALDRVGALRPAELRTIDSRFRLAPRTPAPLDPDIVFVDIDDGAIDAGGRWPWPRAKLGLALGEVARAGAKSVVLDLLLTEPEENAAGDEAVAQALAAAPSVVAIDLGDEDVRRLAQGVQIGARTQRVLESRQKLRALERARGGPIALEEFLAASQPSGGAPLLNSRAIDLLRLVYQQERAWERLAPFFVANGSSDRAGPAAEVSGDDFAKVPILPLAVTARGAGFVNFRPDGDGALRRVDAVRGVRSGGALQLGLAAAALHRGLAKESIKIDRSAARLGDRELSLESGSLWLVWPTARPELGKPGDPEWLRCAPRYSLGYALDLGQTEAELARQSARRDELAAAIAADFGVAAKSDGLLAAIREETRFRLADAAEAEKSGALSVDEEKELEPFRRFDLFERTLAAGATELEQKRGVLATALRGKLVFVGWTATGAASDFVPTPLGARTPGVMAHGVTASMAMTGNALHFAPEWVAPIAIVALGALATAVSLLPVAASVGSVVAVLAAWLVLALAAFGLDARSPLVLPLVAPIAAGGAAWVGTTALRAALAQRDQLRITRQFKARTASELVDWMVDHPDAISMGGEPRDVTCFFVDLAGFTSLSEKLGAQDAVALLNRCMRAMTSALTQHGAYVNKYLGDGLMAFWSAFRPDGEQATHACRAALAAHAALAEVIERTQVTARIGIATGRVIVGDCGAPPQLNDYTAIGDSINLAARLESANKQFGTRILVDGRTRAEATEPTLRFRPCGRVVVVGQTTPVELFELVADDTAVVSDAETERTAAAIAVFQAGDRAHGTELFRSLVRDFGERKLFALYLAALAADELPADGVLHLAAK